MIRLVGILTGSAIAVAILIVTLGMPEFAPPAPATATPPGTPATPATATVAETAGPVMQDTRPETEEAETVVAEAQQVPPVTASVVTTVQQAVDQHWYAFWSPFRSKIAADGFVSQLQKQTGLDYRVVKLKPGVYEVAFAYSDDSDIADKLTQISLATGLDLSGG